jgi:hypothetical protein
MNLRVPTATVTTMAVLALPPGRPAAAPQQGTLFTDDFESGIDRWQILGDAGVSLRATADTAHGTVLALEPNGDDVAALIRGSEAWRGIRLEGDMLFPTAEHSYLGLLYNHTTRGARRDFGLIYIKGNDSYLQLNPHRDLNVSRLIYPEFHVPLDGAGAVDVGVWQRFALEVMGRRAHVYVGDTSAPQMTFDDLEFERGAVGLQPRSVGGPVWVDNIRVMPLDRLSYDGPPQPAGRYTPGDLLTDWQVAGPFVETDDRIARAPSASGLRWAPFAADWRGAVVTARVVDFHGPARVAYFRTSITAASRGRAELGLHSADDLAVWVNGRFRGFYARQPPAWFDFDRNPEHAGRTIPIDLVPGTNEIVLRVIGGVYASGGFFARIVLPESGTAPVGRQQP